jgi:hypothetical protein
VFDPALDVMVYQDNFDQYPSAAAMLTWSAPRMEPTSPGFDPTKDLLVPGRGGIGNAARLHYTTGQERLYYTAMPYTPRYTPATASVFFQYWFRISKNGGPGGSPGWGSTSTGMKWFEMWVPGEVGRNQFSLYSGNATTGPLFHVTPFGFAVDIGDQPVGPYWLQLNNNQWHRATYLYRPASSAGATDGIFRMWIDGTKVVDISLAAAGVTPPGGTKVWCTLTQVQQILTQPVETVNLGEFMNGSLGGTGVDLPMDLDFDDFKWWVRP